MTRALPVAVTVDDDANGDLFIGPDGIVILELAPETEDGEAVYELRSTAFETVEDVPPPTPGPLTRLYRAVQRATRHFFKIFRALAVAIKRAAVGCVRLVARSISTYRERRQRMSYKGRHHAARTWYGRERSTAQLVQRKVSRLRAAQDSQEGELPCWEEEDTFVGWLDVVVMDAFRREQDALHAPVHAYPGERQFICS